MVSVPELAFAHLETATLAERQTDDQKISSWATAVLTDPENKQVRYNEKELNRFLQVAASFSPFLPDAPRPLHFQQYFPSIVWYTLGNTVLLDRQQRRPIAFGTGDSNIFLSLLFDGFFIDSRQPDYFRPMSKLHDTGPFIERFRGQGQAQRKKQNYYALVNYLHEKKIIKMTPKTQFIKLHPWMGMTILRELCQFIRQCSQMTGMEKEWPPLLKCMIVYGLLTKQAKPAPQQGIQ